MHSTSRQKSLVYVLSLILCLSLLGIVALQPRPAFAVTENTQAEMTESQKKIEESAAAYDKAINSLDTLNEELEENKAKISDLEKTLPVQQRKSDDATVALYKLQEDGFNLINMVLEAKSFDEFATTIDYITRIQDINMQEITRLNEMQAELESEQKSFEERKQLVEQEALAAQAALDEAQQLRQAAQNKADAEAAAEAAAAAAAVAEAEAQAQTQAEAQAQTQTQTTLPASSGGGSSAPNPVDWSADKASFVDQWGARIDAYLAGSPTAGYGRVYAEAAWNYGVDPRYSPAISNTESSKGAHCFSPHNAWGWGQNSWGSWEEAINAHVQGLSRGYSHSVCIADAQKYCPPNWQHWYSATLNQMNMI